MTRYLLAWVSRHKAATAVLVLVGLGLLGSLVPEKEADPVSTSTKQKSSTADRGPATATRPGREPARQGEGRERRPAGERRGGVDAGGRSSADTAPLEKPNRRPKPGQPLFLVTRVIDGDTIELGNGETVRLVGIDTPEVGECGYEAAANNLADLLLGKRVRLGISDEDRDSYGRLLRYVDVGATDAGLQLIENGRAIAAYDSRDGYGLHPREPVYIASDRGSTNRCPTMATGSSPEPEASKPRPLVGRGGGSGCASGYSPCLPVAADLDCADVGGPVRVTGADPYRLDADGDGVGCDS